MASLGVLSIWQRAPKEPLYQGKRLSFWAEDYRKACVSRGLPMLDSDSEPVIAIRTIGTNAVPFALRWLENGRMPRWKESLLRVKWPSGVRTVLWQCVYRNQELGANAYPIFMALGPEARTAIPELERMASSPSKVSSMEILRLARSIGPEGLPILAKMLANAPLQYADHAARILRNLGTQGTDIDAYVPSLLLYEARCSQDSAHAHPSTGLADDSRFISIVEASLTNESASVRSEAVRTLGRLALSWPEAANRVCIALNDTEVGVRNLATNIVHQYKVNCVMPPPRTDQTNHVNNEGSAL